MKKYALIVAGGSGKRMKSEIPKQFLPIHQVPILVHTIQKFDTFPDELSIILVLPQANLEDWDQLAGGYRPQSPFTKVPGGATRIDSVRNGLQVVKEDNALVAIHDGVRPMVSHTMIAQSFELAEEKGSAIATVKLKDSIRMFRPEGGGTQSVNREHYRLVQTPQTFQSKLIKGAYRQAGIEHLTDDASVLENMGKTVEIYEGDFKNIKITTPEDLKLAEAWLSF